MSVQLWHMQMFPWNDRNFPEKIPMILEHHKFIGIGDREIDRKYIDDFCHHAKVNDIVAIKNGSTLIALVQVIGDVYAVYDDESDLGWMVYRRPIRVLDWEIDERFLPHTRGTFTPCISEDVETTKIIKDWYEKVKKSFEHRKLSLTV